MDLFKLNQSHSLDHKLDMIMIQSPEQLFSSSHQGNKELLSNFQPQNFSSELSTTIPLPNSLDDSFPLTPLLTSSSSSSSYTNINHLLHLPSSTTKNFTTNNYHANQQNNPSMESMREMMFRIASMQPINIDPESLKPPKRRNVKVSKDPQSVAARHRRERISQRIRILQRLVPGGTKMDTASMLDEAIHYVKFLKRQVQSLEGVTKGKKY